MTMLGRVLASQVKQDLSGFADGGSVSSWARPYVETLVGQGVVEGSNGKLNPQAHITRGEAAKLLAEVNELARASPTTSPLTRISIPRIGTWIGPCSTNKTSKSGACAPLFALNWTHFSSA